MITVGIACYNKERYIADCINSALVQGAHVIVADDGSTDGTHDILKQYDNIDVIYLDGPSGNPTNAKNAIIDACDTEYLFLMDGDDMLAPYSLEVFENCIDGSLSGNESDWVYSNFKLLDENGQPMGEWDYRNFPLTYDDAVEFARINLSNPIPMHALYRTSFIHDNDLHFESFKTTQYAEDFRTSLLWASKNPRIARIHKPLYMYRQHADSSTYTTTDVERQMMIKELRQILGVNDE